MKTYISNYNFDGPYSNTYDLRDTSGVYVILDYSNKVIDVGESQEVKRRVETHDRKSCWERNTNTIYYAVYYTNESDRRYVADRIRQEHNPPCGER